MKQSDLVTKLIKHFGSQVQTAQALKCTQPLISDWLNEKKPVSVMMSLIIEKMTNGEFKASDFNKKAEKYES